MDHVDLLDPPAVDPDESTVEGDAPATAPGLIGAAIIAAFEAAWRAIQARHPEVPDVVMIMGSGVKGGRSPMKFGHFHANTWHGRDPDTADAEKPGTLHEVFIGGEGLARKPWEVMATLLHEAAHGLADAREIKDTSRQGKYHNAKFKALAEELGIVVEKDRTIGWSPTTIPEQTIRVYEDEIDALGLVLTRYRDARADGAAAKRKTPPLTCECGRKIRASKKVLAEGPIMCAVCAQPFEAREGDDDEGDEGT